ncbi:DUF4041 domain-containing protein [Bifidobacterium sp. SO1]|uniref:DUF4041 domain-containing protein n=1 Tax=Bifidobacterium sp. SO1 TaxID=2809029 RepID=UPI001BDD0E93|nr:DUF4041 domain-containing protein [Bifidobacterium sp. SO1]MBT1161744.1 DUF4041 domain-containing protein [Bifidobacterium sp. SO1]
MGRHSATTSTTSNTRIPLFGRRKLISQLLSENNRLEALVAESGLKDVDSRRRELERLTSEIDRNRQSAETERNRLRNERLDLENQIAELGKRILDLHRSDELQDAGFYDYDNPAMNSVSLGDELARNRESQKRMIRNQRAVLAVNTGFTFNGSTAQGSRFIKDMKDMALGLYNAEAENCVKGVRAGNLETSIKRLRRCADRIERFGRMISLSIDADYRKLREEELTLTAKYMQALKAEKEAEKARRDELREQAKAQKELEAQAAKLRKEREHYATVLATMKSSGDEVKAAELETKLETIDRSIEDADYRAANTRAGYVYVISDIGAFGEGVVKIGMTRRLDPLDRIRELSSASVPFQFDVHALFFSEDAVGLETALHHDFEARRVNKVNARKEFFRVTPQEVLDRLRERNVAVVEFKVEPDAEEYRATLALESASPAV